MITLERCHFAWNIVFGQPGFMLTNFTRFEVDKKIIYYFSYFIGKKKQKNKHCPKIVKRIYLGELPINIVGKITSEIGVPWLRWTNQINNSTIGVDINE